MQIGTLIDAYRIDALIGQGGMGQVYKAWHTGLHCFHALKMLPPECCHDKALVQRFLGEARNMARLHHPNIVTIHTVSEADTSHPYFAMELVEGIDLTALIQEHGCISLPETLPILRQIASALDYAHRQGLVHRDIKPGNILLKQDGTGQGYTIKIVDFGIAKAQDADNSGHTKTGMIIGTPEYMSPEQALGQPVGPFSDQYALGIVAYEMLCGRPPFKMEQDGSLISVMMKHAQAPPPALTAWNSSLPATVNAAILKALSKNPNERFDSCSSFGEALTHPPTVVAKPGSAVPPPPRNYLPFAGVGVLLLLGISLIAYPMLQPTQEQPVAGPAGPVVEATLPSAPPEVIDELVNVPDLIGKNKQQALEIIAAKSLKAEVLTGHSEAFAAQSVASQSPKTGTRMPVGSVLRIRVSLGPKVIATPTSPVPSGEEVRAIKRRYREWLDAWQQMNYETYESFYSRALVQVRPNRPAHGFSSLRKRMTEHWAKQRFISINSDEPSVRYETHGAAVWVVLTATQHYESSTWWDIGTKNVAWRKENGEWKIVRESFIRKSGGSR